MFGRYKYGSVKVGGVRAYATETASGTWATPEQVELWGKSVRVLRAGVRMVLARNTITVTVAENGVRLVAVPGTQELTATAGNNWVNVVVRE